MIREESWAMCSDYGKSVFKRFSYLIFGASGDHFKSPMLCSIWKESIRSTAIRMVPIVGCILASIYRSNINAVPTSYHSERSRSASGLSDIRSCRRIFYRCPTFIVLMKKRHAGAIAVTVFIVCRRRLIIIR